MAESIEKLFGGTNREALFDLISTGEEWLMERILHYAILHGYSKYTSTLKEPWRASIEGLSTSLLATLKHYDAIPEFGPEEDWQNDPCGEFGRREADLHRQRGVPLAMFLGLMKYYRQSYIDLVKETDAHSGDREWAEIFINRVFDRIEINFCQNWSGIENETLIEDLQKKNRWLVNEKNKFLTLFESYSMPCFFVDHTGKLDSMNLAAAEVFNLGLTAGENYYRTRKDEAVPVWLRAEIRAFSLGHEDSQIFEKQYREDKEEQVYVVHLKRMLDVSEKFSGVVVSLADVTQRIKDQKIIEESHSNLLKTQDQLVQREKLASLGQLAAGMAHNFNNNLSIILGNIELSQLITQEPKITDPLNNAKTAVLRSRDIVSKIITYSRQGAQHKTTMQLQNIIDETISLLRSTMPSSISLKKSVDPVCNSQHIYGDASQIQEILINLYNNAARAMEDKGVLTILMEPAVLCQADIPVQYEATPGHYLKLSVCDTGSGVPAEIQNKIFDPFFTTKEEHEGAGMGLATVQGIVAQHRGLIKVNSNPVQGTTFQLYFPVVDQHQKEDVNKVLELKKGTEAILYVDDDDMIAELGGKMLAAMGYQVTVKTDSLEALELFKADMEKFDLIITDQTMPKLTGKELIQKIKTLRLEIPIILCTGYDDKGNKEDARESGISSFLMKPVEFNELSQVVRGVLDKNSED